MDRDRILIRGLKARASVGVTEQEQTQRTELSLDVTLFFDLEPSAQSDELNDTIDYAYVAERLKQYINDSQCCLLETLAKGIITHLREEFHPKGVHVRILKPDFLDQVDAVGIEMERMF